MPYELAEVGVPVVDSLTEAVAIAAATDRPRLTSRLSRA